MTTLEEAICQKCHHMRSPSLKIPCEHCGAKQTLFGYLWPHEFKGYLTLVIGIATLIILAILAALGFWALLQLRGQQVNIGTIFVTSPKVNDFVFLERIL